MPIAVVHAGLHEVGVHIVLHEVLAGEVNHRARVACLVDDEEAGDACILCHLGVVGTKGRSDVYNASTVFRSDIIARDDAEGFCTLIDDFTVLKCARLHPREELFVLQANEVSSFASPKNLELFTFFRLEVSREARLGENVNGLLVSIWIAAFDGNIINLRANTESRVGRQSPRRRGPSQNVYRSTLSAQSIQIILSDTELCCHRGVLHVPVAAGLVEFVARQACSCGWRIRLDGVAFIEKVLLVELLQKPPKCLDVLVVIGDVGVFHIDPVTHFVAKVGPLAGVHHHVLAALLVVLLDADALSDIFLRDAKLFFYTKLNGKSVCVPACFTLHLVALHRLEAAESVLDAASQDVMNAGMSVS